MDLPGSLPPDVLDRILGPHPLACFVSKRYRPPPEAAAGIRRRPTVIPISALVSPAQRAWAVESGLRFHAMPFSIGKWLRVQVESGHLEVLKWALEDFLPAGFDGWRPLNRNQGWTLDVCEYAAEAGQLEVLQWAFANGCIGEYVERNKDLLIRAAAKGGNLALLQWLRANGCPWPRKHSTVCGVAARHGHLPLLQWACANGCACDMSTCSEAAVGGQLGVLQWLRANGCPWDVYTCQRAAIHGHLPLLQWARDNGCPEQ